MPFSVFISYRRDDLQGHARALYGILEARFPSGTVFFDRDHSAISEGQNFRDRILQALGDSRVMLALIGKEWLNARDPQGQPRLHQPDDVVRLEIETALQRRLVIIPVLFDGCPPLKASDLPASLAGLSMLDAFMLQGKTDEYRQGCDRLIALIEQVSGAAGRARYSAKPPHVRRLREIQQHYLGRGANRPAFVGREAELRALGAWLADDRAPASLLLVGAAALGKTSLVLNWLGDPQAVLCGHSVVFLPISVRFDTNTPDLFWSMAAARLAQLAELEFEAPSTRLAEAYLAICLDALDRLEEMGQPLLLVIDGLDEATGWQIDQRLFLNSRPAVRVLVSARAVGARTAAVDRWLQAIGWRRGRQTAVLELLPLGRPAVLDAVKDFSLRRGAPAADATTLGEEIWRLSSGDPLLLGYYLDDLVHAFDNPSADVLAVLAAAHAGFANYFSHWVNVQKPYWLEDGGRVDLLDGLLALLACAHGPIVTADIEQLLARSVGLKTPLSRARLQALNRFVIETAEGWTLDHPRLQSHLLDEFSPDGGWIAHARKAFVDWVKEVCGPAPATAGTHYLSRYGALHLAASDASAQDLMLLASAPWARLSLIEDDSGRQLTMDLEVASRELSARAAPHDPLQAWQWSIFLMHVSAVSRAHLLPELLAAFARQGLLRRDSALRRLDLMPARERALGLALLSGDVLVAERGDLLAESLVSIPTIKDFKHRMLAWAQVLHAGPGTPEGCQAEAALLRELQDAGSMFHWLQAVERMAPLVSVETQQQLLHWTFSQVRESRDWHYLDALLPDLYSELFDEAVSLAIAVSQRLSLLREKGDCPVSDRLSRIDEAALPHVFPALHDNEKDRCWKRVHELNQGSKYLESRVEGLATVFPWLLAEGRDNEVRHQLDALHKESRNPYAMAMALARFARHCRPAEIAEWALKLALDIVIKRLQDRVGGVDFDLVIDLLDESGVERCFQVAMQARPALRQEALAQLASRLSAAQLIQVRELQLRFGDEVDVANTQMALQLQDTADLDGSRLNEARQALLAACPVALPDSAPRGADALLMAQPNDAEPAALWAAIQRQEHVGAQVYSLLAHYSRLRDVVPIEEMTHAVGLLIGDGKFADALTAIDLLPDDVARPLREQFESRVASNSHGWIGTVKCACLLAMRGPDRARWHQFALDVVRDRKIESPEVHVLLLSSCSQAQRPAHLETIRRSCADDYSLGLSALIDLIPLLEPHETPPFVAPWLAAIRNKCQETPDWLSQQGPVPEPFATATMNAMPELLQGAPRTCILKFMAAWAVPIAQAQGISGLHALMAGTRAAGQAFE